ncbi:MAG: hypothetical protein ACJ8GJ_15895 [Vitreoscilla sp.]
MDGDPIREDLQRKVWRAVNELLHETGTDAFAIPIPDSDPPRFVAVGTQAAIKALVVVPDSPSSPRQARLEPGSD